ncbi:hypothetical protein [Vibrio sp. SCSIO 43136]|uniref:hypothetical protein n=1 Tax=Vibrio sp. SCSIO 43136 TaxID=2819101 RepID=UPI00207592B6|nr:hypothetical protein [Vibrio sp. SCSIO 43136]USD64100.1 hypothetical protein J4N39_08200 [Vibrio sp. SCSIO 43136]
MAKDTCTIANNNTSKPLLYQHCFSKKEAAPLNTKPMETTVNDEWTTNTLIKVPPERAWLGEY